MKMSQQVPGGRGKSLLPYSPSAQKVCSSRSPWAFVKAIFSLPTEIMGHKTEVGEGGQNTKTQST